MLAEHVGRTGHHEQVLPAVRRLAPDLHLAGDDDVEPVTRLTLGEDRRATRELRGLQGLRQCLCCIRLHALEDPCADQYLVHSIAPRPRPLPAADHRRVGHDRARDHQAVAHHRALAADRVERADGAAELDAERALAGFGVELPLSALFESPTVEQMALAYAKLAPPAKGNHKTGYALDIKEIIADGDMAAVRLLWTLTSKAKSGETKVTEEQGLDIFGRSSDGRWQIIRFMSFEKD